MHRENAFVTLTYNDECLPPELQRRDAQLWIKSLRKAVEPLKIRYLIVGEYGDKTNRPHYHALIFGLGKRYAQLFAETWGKGFCYTGEVTPESCAYVARYTLKKLTDTNIPEELQALAPTFALQSLKPGIGANFCDQLAEGLMSHKGINALAQLGDVPGEFQIGKRKLPLDRYMKQQLRSRLGWEKNMPALKKAQLVAEKAHQSADEIATRHKRGKAAQFRAAAAALHARSKSVI